MTEDDIIRAGVQAGFGLYGGTVHPRDRVWIAELGLSVEGGLERPPVDSGFLPGDALYEPPLELTWTEYYEVYGDDIDELAFAFKLDGTAVESAGLPAKDFVDVDGRIYIWPMEGPILIVEPPV
jgi:hypothetical protein